MDFAIISFAFLAIFCLGGFCVYAMLVISKAWWFKCMGYGWRDAIIKAQGYYR